MRDSLDPTTRNQEGKQNKDDDVFGCLIGACAVVMVVIIIGCILISSCCLR